MLRNRGSDLLQRGSGGRIRTCDLWVMRNREYAHEPAHKPIYAPKQLVILGWHHQGSTLFNTEGENHESEFVGQDTDSGLPAMD
jgi:hypothetical protein